MHRKNIRHRRRPSVLEKKFPSSPDDFISGSIRLAGRLVRLELGAHIKG